MKRGTIKAEIVLICILLINVFVLFYNKSNPFSILSFINVCFIYFIFFIILPFLMHIEKSRFDTKSIRIFTLLRVLTGAFFYFTIYQIYFSKDYTLKYTYYIWFFIIFLSFLLHIADLFATLFWNQKHKIKKYGLFFTLNLIIVSALSFLWSVSLYDYLIIPGSRIELSSVKIPKEITIYMNTSAKTIEEETTSSYVVINNADDINKIISDLNDNLIKNFTPYNRLNYIRMKGDNKPIYTLAFTYDQTGSLKDNYIPFMEITGNRFTVIENLQNKYSILSGSLLYSDLYPVSLSDDTLTLIFNYIKLIK